MIRMLGFKSLSWTVFTSNDSKVVRHKSWCLCRRTFLTVVCKVWYTWDTSYIIQTIISYQYSALTKDLQKYVDLHNNLQWSDNYLQHEKGSKIQILFTESSWYFSFFKVPVCIGYFCHFDLTPGNWFSLAVKI